MKNAGDLIREKGTAVYTIAPEDTVFEALERMAEKNVGALLVFEGDQMVGLISERDYARKIILKDKRSKETSVKEIMTTDVVTVTRDKDLEQCMELMTDKYTRHLPVIENQKVIGIISIGDIVKGIIDHKEYIIEQLERYIKGHPA